MKTYYDESDLVNFGNYLLILAKQGKTNGVSDAHIRNWKLQREKELCVDESIYKINKN